MYRTNRPSSTSHTVRSQQGRNNTTTRRRMNRRTMICMCSTDPYGSDIVVDGRPLRANARRWGNSFQKTVGMTPSFLDVEHLLNCLATTIDRLIDRSMRATAQREQTMRNTTNNTTNTNNSARRRRPRQPLETLLSSSSKQQPLHTIVPVPLQDDVTDRMDEYDAIDDDDDDDTDELKPLTPRDDGTQVQWRRTVPSPDVDASLDDGLTTYSCCTTTTNTTNIHIIFVDICCGEQSLDDSG